MLNMLHTVSYLSLYKSAYERMPEEVRMFVCALVCKGKIVIMYINGIYTFRLSLTHDFIMTQCPLSHIIESTSCHSQPPLLQSYLDVFPFPFYIVLREITALPMVLAQALRQWFELVTNQT